MVYVVIAIQFLEGRIRPGRSTFLYLVLSLVKMYKLWISGSKMERPAFDLHFFFQLGRCHANESKHDIDWK